MNKLGWAAHILWVLTGVFSMAFLYAGIWSGGDLQDQLITSWFVTFMLACGGGMGVMIGHDYGWWCKK